MKYKLFTASVILIILFTVFFNNASAKIFSQTWQANVIHCNGESHTMRLTDTIVFAKTMYKELSSHCVRDVHAWRIK